MKTHGFMILVRIHGSTTGFEPINPKYDLDYDPWFFSKNTCMDALYALQRREDAKEHGKQNEYLFSFVKG